MYQELGAEGKKARDDLSSVKKKMAADHAASITHLKEREAKLIQEAKNYMSLANEAQGELLDSMENADSMKEELKMANVKNEMMKTELRKRQIPTLNLEEPRATLVNTTPGATSVNNPTDVGQPTVSAATAQMLNEAKPKTYTPEAFSIATPKAHAPSQPTKEEKTPSAPTPGTSQSSGQSAPADTATVQPAAITTI